MYPARIKKSRIAASICSVYGRQQMARRDRKETKRAMQLCSRYTLASFPPLGAYRI